MFFQFLFFFSLKNIYIKMHSPLSQTSQKNVYIIFFLFQGNSQNLLGSGEQLTAIQKCEMMESGSYNSLAQHRKCTNFVSQNHSTLGGRGCTYKLCSKVWLIICPLAKSEVELCSGWRGEGGISMTCKKYTVVVK